MSTTPPPRNRNSTTESSPEQQLARLRKAADTRVREAAYMLDLPVDVPRSLRRTERETWLIRFDGSEASVGHYAGLTYFAKLLADPDHAIEAVELEGVGEEFHEAGVALPGQQRDEARIRAAISEARSQIQEHEKERDRLLKLNDDEAALREDERIEIIEKSISQYAKRGRERDDSAPAVKARKRVRGALDYARERIAEKLPELAAYLRQHEEGTGAAFVFRPPDGDPEWTVDPGDF